LVLKTLRNKLTKLCLQGNQSNVVSHLDKNIHQYSQGFLIALQVVAMRFINAIYCMQCDVSSTLVHGTASLSWNNAGALRHAEQTQAAHA